MSILLVVCERFKPLGRCNLKRQQKAVWSMSAVHLSTFIFLVAKLSSNTNLNQQR